VRMAVLTEVRVAEAEPHRWGAAESALVHHVFLVTRLAALVGVHHVSALEADHVFRLILSEYSTHESIRIECEV